MIAASEDKASTNWPWSDSLSRSCGSIFASSIINTLTSTSNPLFDDIAQNSSTGEEDMRNDQALSSTLQPERPNAEQISTYNKFCDAVWNSYQNLRGQDSSNTSAAPPGNATDAFHKTMIECMRNDQAQELARIFYKRACPGDWNRGINRQLWRYTDRVLQG
ncbi:hypothetical protein F5Y16DRAFT_423307 [Xylariaceae sp. FL0255]|nr:hypothetical protein F5Y16DRAFT_423307 [Xylariaceae sp. FL0255]